MIWQKIVLLILSPIVLTANAALIEQNSPSEALSTFRGDNIAPLPKEALWKLYLLERTQEIGLSYKEFLLLRRIAHCESTWRQYENDGSVLRGRWSPRDLGLFQINSYVHDESARLVGYDLTTPEGNIDYALYLYQSEGVKPWTPSLKCIGSYTAY